MSRNGFQFQQKTYYAAWLEGTDDDGERQTVCVVFSSDFSEIYAEEELNIDHKDFSDAPMEICFEATPRPGTSLSTTAFSKHVVEKEALPKLSEVFCSVRDSIDRFVAFDGTLGTQEEMCEFLACWAISTYASEAFGTVGYLWPVGEKGSGKTQCLNTVIRLSYLGLVTTSSSSFPAIRNNAILGGTIGFDDCENLKGMDQNKRELLLAGNTKGAIVMLMEPGSKEGQWQEKYIDAFAPRAFTSIAIPDPVLASRTFTPQLIKSADKERTRRNPSDANDWAVDPSTIVDNVWLHVAQGFPAILAKKTDVSEAVDAHGREFDIFQPSLTIAKWIEDEGGVEGLFDRMNRLMERYLEQKTEIQLPSPADVLIPALYREVFKEGKKQLTTGSITNLFQRECERLDITDDEYTSLDIQRIGMLMKRLGFSKVPSHGKQRSWIVSEVDVRKAAKNQGISLPEPNEDADEDESGPSEVTKPSVVTSFFEDRRSPDRKPAAPWE